MRCGGLVPLISTWLTHLISVAQDESPEVTGPADSNYLSNLHSFRLARTEVQAAQGTARRLQAMQNYADDRDPELAIHQPPTIATDHDVTVSSGLLPDQQSDVLQAPDFSLYTDTAASNDPVSALDPAVEEYIRLADEMSNYFTWDASEYPAMSYMESYDSYL